MYIITRNCCHCSVLSFKHETEVFFKSHLFLFLILMKLSKILCALSATKWTIVSCRVQR